MEPEHAIVSPHEVVRLAIVQDAIRCWRLRNNA